jgi:hypothetical protein
MSVLIWGGGAVEDKKGCKHTSVRLLEFDT